MENAVGRRAALILLLLVTLAPGAPAGAQPLVQGAPAPERLHELPHRSWTSMADLQATPVWAITQDAEGYLWLGVRGGLVRFDGTSFVRWDALSGEALPEQEVRALHAARDGSLWVGFGNAGGVSRIRDGAAHTYPPGDGLPGGPIWALHEDRQGTLWAGGAYGVSRFRDGGWERVGADRGIASDRVMLFQVHEDAAGELWLGTVAGLYRYRPASDTFDRIVSAGRVVRSVTSIPEGPLWVAGEPLGLRQAGPVQPAQAAGLVPELTAPLLRDRRGHLWGGTAGAGVVRIGDREWAGSTAVERLTPADGLTGSRINTLHEDRAGNIWIGTDGGLDYVAVDSPNVLGVRTELAGRYVTSLAAGAQGSLWAGTSDGVYRMSDGGATLHRIGDGGMLDGVSAVHQDRQGTVWAAAFGALVRFEDGRFTRVPLPGGLTLFRVTAMTSDAGGGLWLCDATGLYRLQAGALTDYSGAPAVAGRTPVGAYTDMRGRVWIGFADGGLVSFEDGQAREYPDEAGVTSGPIRAFFEDGDGGLWVGSHRGLARLERGRFVGLSDSGRPGGHDVIGITQDHEGLIWVVTAAHVLRFAPAEFMQAAADPAYRFAVVSDWGPWTASPEWWGSYTTSTRTTDGELWIPTPDGARVIDPRQIAGTDPRAVRVDRVRFDQQPHAAAARARVPADATRIEIEYSTPAFDVPARFRYMLEGFDQDWVEVGAFRQAFYTNLPPREYRFRVAASYGGARWVEAEPWQFTVLPTIYETAAFRAAAGLALVLMVLGAWRLRLRYVRQQFALVVGERARVGREIHDTLLQGMAGVAMQVHAVSESLDGSQTQARAALNSARDALEHYMREARRSIWELRGPSLESLDLPAAIEALGERLTAGGATRFTLRVRGVPRRCDPQLKHHLLRVCGEAISNAVQHARPDEIAVELSYDDDAVKVCVRDDGLGFDVEQVEREPRRHWGLAGMRERAAQLGAALTLVSVPSGGTRVEITAPFVEAE